MTGTTAEALIRHKRQVGRPGWVGPTLRGVALLLLALCSWVTPAPARPTAEHQARQLVQNWLARETRPLGAALGRQVRDCQTYRDAAGEIQYFVVYLAPQGFVIVPGDDLAEPVIAFAPQGQFDPSPDNPLGLLVSQDVPRRLRQAKEAEDRARAQGVPFVPKGAKREARRKWQELARPPLTATTGTLAGATSVSDHRVDPLVQSQWAQSTVNRNQACYNYYTPPYSQGNPANYVSGCTATAMAQIMRYFRWPTVGVGTASLPITVDGIPQNRPLRGGDGAGGSYIWDSMVLVPDSTITDAQRQAIGALTADAGVAARMDYAASGSAAYTEDARTALVTTFGYGNAIVGVSSGTVPTASLITMINPNLDASLPVLLGIYSSIDYSLGHAVVADGYGYNGATLYHHLNMGWASTGDAWYNLPTISAAGYSFDQVGACLYNIFTTGSGEIISGRVMSGGTPLSGATVIAARNGGGTYYAATDANGIYALKQVQAASTYTLTAVKDGYAFNTLVAATGTSVSSTLYSFSTVTGNYWGADLAASAAVIPLSTALDNITLSFTSGGNAPWFGQAAVSYAGGSAAQSGAISAGQTSTLQTVVSGPGSLSFSWKVSSQANSDFLEFYLDDNPPRSISGEVNWQRQTITIPPGPHTLKWTYAKDAAGSTGADAGWLDRVRYTRGGNLSPVIQLLLQD